MIKNIYKIIIVLIVISFILVAGAFFYYNKYSKNNFIKESKNTDQNIQESIIVKRDANRFVKRNLTEEELKCENCNLVIISLTNTRKDHIGVYGYERNTTPNIDRFFQDSLLFENAFAPASWTLPVAISLHSSLFPYRHGVMDRYDGSRLEDNVMTLAEILKQNGYRTAGFTGGGDYNGKFNFAQGFDIYIDEGGAMGPGSYFGTEKSIPQSIDWLSNIDIKNKFFLLVQGFDTHCPFTPRESFDERFTRGYKSDIDFSTCLWTFEQTEPIYENGVRYWPVKTMFDATRGIEEIKLTDKDVEYMIALYDGEIAQSDAGLEDFFRLIKEKDLEKNTIFIFMSEHGDLFGEHGRFMRGGPLRGTFYDPVLNFPLVVRHPKIKEPIKVDTLIQTVDLMPTLLEMFGIEDDQREVRQGKSFAQALVTGEEVNKYVFAGSKYKSQNGNPYFQGISVVEAARSKEWKIIKEEIFDQDTNEKTHESHELYNISEDPKEENNLYDTNSEMAKKLKTILENFSQHF